MTLLTIVRNAIESAESCAKDRDWNRSAWSVGLFDGLAGIAIPITLSMPTPYVVGHDYGTQLRLAAKHGPTNCAEEVNDGWSE